jgi:hypothetical protein
MIKPTPRETLLECILSRAARLRRLRVDELNCFLYVSIVIPRIRELLHAAPFEPFAVRTSDGRQYAVPTPDHAAVHPTAPRVIVFLDNGGQIDISGLHLAAVVKNGQLEGSAGS